VQYYGRGVLLKCHTFWEEALTVTTRISKRDQDTIFATGKPMVNLLTHIFIVSGEKTPIPLFTAPLKEKDGLVRL
jgi:hypothetical protein